MSQLVVLNLGKGDGQQGFPAVTAQLWQSDAAVPMQFTGSLPAAPALEQLYAQWQKYYEALNADRQWRRMENTRSSMEFDIDEDDITHVSRSEFDRHSQTLNTALNQWLNHPGFHTIDRKLRTQLIPNDEIRLIITAQSDRVLKLPWCLWSFFEDFPKAELALSPTDYTRVTKTVISSKRSKVRILAILGNSQGIDVTQDQALLKQLPNAEIEFLVEPTRSQLSQQLWASGWDILFFAGHSSSQSSSQGQGQIQISPEAALTIEQLKYGLKQAINQGLKLAIFNSCDGLGLARDLADLQIPQVIVMREPVSDRVAHIFLTQFLSAFAQGKSLYLSVREAREKLQDLEDDFPCATWLPVICQNPAEVPQSWQDWCNLAKPWVRLPSRLEWQRLLVSSAIATGFVLGVRFLGLLQPMELWAFDQMIRLRPTEPPDPKLLIVTITEEDIQAQGNEPRKGSLSDRTLKLLLTKLEQYQAAGIGLDLYRDFPVEANQPELAKLMKQSDRLITICKRPDPTDDPTGILPPPEVPQDRLGFSDFVEDRDGVLRRQLLLMSANPLSPCTPAQSFATAIAFQYLQQKNITAEFTPQGNLRLGKRVYPKLSDRASGYQALDAKGSQLLLNYRSTPRQIAQQVTVGQILKGQINQRAVSNRIVLIGVASNSSGDYWATPYGSGFGDRVPGVFLQGQMVSQMVNAALNQRPLLGVWPLGVEVLWIVGWAVWGGGLMIYLRRPIVRIIANGLGFVLLLGTCFTLLIVGVWVPWVPVLIACVVAESQVIYVIHRSPNKPEISGDTS
jgi:CHASE2 domain-containing sensor protein